MYHQQNDNTLTKNDNGPFYTKTCNIGGKMFGKVSRRAAFVRVTPTTDPPTVVN